MIALNAAFPRAAQCEESPASPTRPTITLTEAYQRARARSEELLAARERITEAEINADRAWSTLKPTLSTSFTYTHTEPKPRPFPSFPNLSTDIIRENCVQDGSIEQNLICLDAVRGAIGEAANAPPFDLVGQDTSAFNTNLAWNIFNGRAFPLIANANDAVLVEHDRFESNLRDLFLGVARSYYGAAATKQAISAAERARDRAQRELSLVEKQAEVGEGVRARLVAAKIAANQATTDVRRAMNAHQQALLVLALLTRSEDQPDVVTPPAPDRPAGTRQELQKIALEKREDYRAAIATVTIAERAEDEVWWRFAPTIALFGSYRYSNVSGLSGQKDQFAAGVTATLLLYDGGLRYEDLRSAESRIRAANHAVSSLRARLESDIERALLKLEGAELTIGRARDTMLLAKEREELTRAQYEVGALRGIELKDASDAVLDAELAIIRADMEHALAVLELQRAVGVFAP